MLEKAGVSKLITTTTKTKIFFFLFFRKRRLFITHQFNWTSRASEIYLNRLRQFWNIFLCLHTSKKVKCFIFISYEQEKDTWRSVVLITWNSIPTIPLQHLKKCNIIYYYGRWKVIKFRYISFDTLTNYFYS